MVDVGDWDAITLNRRREEIRASGDEATLALVLKDRERFLRIESEVLYGLQVVNDILRCLVISID